MIIRRLGPLPIMQRSKRYMAEAASASLKYNQSKLRVKYLNSVSFSTIRSPSNLVISIQYSWYWSIYSSSLILLLENQTPYALDR